MLKRKIYQQLLYWKENHKKSTLMIQGARQVGKTFIIREFGKKEYKSFIEINFIKNPQLKEIFSQDLDADTIYKNMSAQIKNINFITNDTLIFFDEIQACGRARTSLKFLAEDGRYDIITSGSLLGLSYGEDADENVEEPDSIPTGYESFLTLYSLDFEEFLWANGYSEEAIKILKNYFNGDKPIPPSINNKYENLFREFIVVGGMPEVVNDYVKNHDFNRVDKKQNKILDNYRFDISKHAKGAEKVKVRKCYDAVPKQLAKVLTKFQYSTVEKGQTSKKYGGSIQWLKDSNLVNPCYNIKEPYIPLLANSIDEQFKLYINDTGLLCAMYGFEVKKAILMNTIKGNAKGGIYENIISECLTKNGFKLHYYKPNDNQELEFLIEKDGEVIPVEVKAGNTASASLNNFIEHYKPSIAYKLASSNLGIVDCKKTIPHYMVMFIKPNNF